MVVGLLLVLLAGTVSLMADDGPGGRDVAAAGVFGTVEGFLFTEKGEWYLSSDGTTYEIHMGNLGHSGSIQLEEGAYAKAEAFIMDTHLAPVSLETGENTYHFWTEDRRPVWAGSGNGQKTGRGGGE